MRMYKNEIPSLYDKVTVHITKVDDHVAHANLLEYDNMEAIVILSQITKKRIRSIKNYIYPGKIDVYCVSSVDDKIITLNKHDLSADEIVEQNDKYIKSSKVHNIISHIASITDIDIMNIYAKYIWPLYEDYGHALDAFKKIARDATLLDKYELEDKIKTELINAIDKYIVTCHTTINKKFELTCYEYEGVDAITNSLFSGKKKMNELNKEDNLLASKIKDNFVIRYLGAPLYEISIVFAHTVDIKKCHEIADTIIDTIELYIKKHDGSLIMVK